MITGLAISQTVFISLTRMTFVFSYDVNCNFLWNDFLVNFATFIDFKWSMTQQLFKVIQKWKTADEMPQLVGRCNLPDFTYLVEMRQVLVLAKQ